MLALKHPITCLALSALATFSWAQADDISERDRRYLNPVFEKTERHGDIEFARVFNDSSGETEILAMRIFEPVGDDARLRPLLVLTPGGGFVATGDDWMDDVAHQIAQAGYVVALNQYRLATSIEGPDLYFDALLKSVADQKSAIAHLVDQAKASNPYRIDLNNVFIGGHSAGAIISMHTGYLDPGDALLPGMAEPIAKFGGLGQLDSDVTVRGIINLAGLVTDVTILDASEPPLLSIHGDNDATVPLHTGEGVYGSVPLDTYANSIGVDSVLHVIEGAKHIDTSTPAICEECVPMMKRFMFNRLDLAKPTPATP
ncbi:alpha/beta hydrolase fold domain-containing protein [Gilvimarinus sp. SDUM040013]|uniref:Alpha/beta hydrolase fold domain-containing protein n=1 Tax=Gilvimarinus gilvus TaxID=3058038 RepID=A0ABU4RXR8_9GAMM|nr:alpha/beta hydrolase fold domain-containing protein [Gilvimarinus sp. SDUM040013]MDO3388710.1 alpha/beta hydrolase fold domain-containing protein [Gilvimarinus sp. SDUM040013]MDX6849605.1 alpha/beta hydrolase fold domain-containing protein [Gilvimarinus sp. SDUM040013]